MRVLCIGGPSHFRFIDVLSKDMDFRTIHNIENGEVGGTVVYSEYRLKRFDVRGLLFTLAVDELLTEDQVILYIQKLEGKGIIPQLMAWQGISREWIASRHVT